MQKTSLMKFGLGSRYLNPFSLEYGWFGAIWSYTESTRRVEGYWFGHDKKDVITLAKKAGWQNWTESTNSNELQDVYDAIRKKQKLSDWKRSSLFSLKAAYAWRNISSGWYIIRSTPSPYYPFYISAIRKNYCFVWLVHTDICENSNDLQLFIKKVNDQHHIKLVFNE